MMLWFALEKLPLIMSKQQKEKKLSWCKSKKKKAEKTLKPTCAEAERQRWMWHSWHKREDQNKGWERGMRVRNSSGLAISALAPYNAQGLKLHASDEYSVSGQAEV